MPDASHAPHDDDRMRHDADQAWRDAFARLPQTAPETSQWSAIAAKLDARAQASAETGTHAAGHPVADDHTPPPHVATGTPAGMPSHPRAWALAASLLVALALPLAWMLRDDGRQTGGPSPFASTQPSPTTGTHEDASSSPTASLPPASSPGDAAPVAVAINAVDAPQPTVIAAPRTAPGITSRHATAAVTHPARLASAKLPQPSTAVAGALDGDDTRRGGDDLESLYAASAQLESLLALARDTRAESGPAAVYASTLDARVAQIDAQLTQLDLEPSQQTRLWRARVDTLREAADFETDLRMLAAQGQSFEGTLAHLD